jgi:hypothetical protein
VELFFFIPTPIQSRVRKLVLHYTLIISFYVSVIPPNFKMYLAKASLILAFFYTVLGHDDLVNEEGTVLFLV